MKWTTGSLPRGGAGDHTAGHHDNTSMKWRWQHFQLSGLGYRRNEVALLVGPGWESKSPQNKGESPTISRLPPIVCNICTVTFFLLQRYRWDVLYVFILPKKSYMSCTEHPCCYCDKFNFHLWINESTVVQQQKKCLTPKALTIYQAKNHFTVSKNNFFHYHHPQTNCDICCSKIV